MNSKDKSAKAANKKAEILDSAASKTHIVVAQAEAPRIQTMADKAKTLDAKEQELLAECEADIEQTQQGAFVFGYRLMQIRDQNLHRAEYKTFEIYCRQRWDFSTTHVNRLIKAYECEKHLKSIKDMPVYVPTRESQVRYFADLAPEQQVEVAHAVYEAVGDKEASAGDFGAAREQLFPKPKPAPKPVTKTTVDIAPAPVPVKFDTNLVSFTEINKRLQAISNICDNSAKKQEALVLITKLQRVIDDWAEWQAKQLIPGEAA